MKIKQKFNTVTYNEYIYIIDNYQKITNFNTLGLFRSIVETKKLDLNQKIAIRDYANQKFNKTFEFLQLKDPETYFDLKTLGENLTVADETQIRKNIKINQEQILKDKRIKHRNFGDYSKHNCGYEWCPYNGLMIKQDSLLSEGNMRFNSDKCKNASFAKSEKYQKEKRRIKQLIQKELADE